MTDSMQSRAEKLLQAAILAFLRKYPMHAGRIGWQLFTADPSVNTMCVMRKDGEIAYRYAPRFVLDCTLEELVGVLHHEVLHLLFRHPDADQRLFPNRQARIIAEEVTVNECVPEPLPGKPVRLEQFPYLPPGEDTVTRYERLAARDDLPSGIEPTDNHGVWRNLDDLSEQELMEMLMEFRTPREMPAELRAVVERRVMRRHVPDLHGPARVETLGQSAAPFPPLPWQLLLQRAGVVAARREVTYNRPPRRQPWLVGIVPGYRLRVHQSRIMAVIDTSGSMHRGQLEDILRELRQLAKLGAVTVVECDNEIRGTYPLRGRIERMAGRGGTDLRPPFEPAHLASVRPDMIVYFTDGNGPAPNHAPRCPVIWCLTPGGRRPADWGLAVELPGTPPAPGPAPRAEMAPREERVSDTTGTPLPQWVDSNGLFSRPEGRRPPALRRRSRDRRLRRELLSQRRAEPRIILDYSHLETPPED